MARGAESMARAGEGRVIEQDAIKEEQSASEKDRYAIKSEQPRQETNCPPRSRKIPKLQVRNRK